MRRRSLFAVLIALAFVGLLGFGLVKEGSHGPEVGDPAPAQAFTPLEGGSETTLDEFRGRWVLVNFWASWCEPCEAESPALERLQRRYGGEDFTVLGIATRDVTDDSRRFVQRFGLSYPQFRDRDGKVASAWGTTGVPESFLIDPEGVVRVKQPGAVDEALIDSLFVSMLEEDGGLTPKGGGQTADEGRS